MEDIEVDVDDEAVGNEGDPVEERKNWEKEFEKPWEQVQEDEKGILNVGTANERRMKKRRLQNDTRTIRRGMHRHLFIIIDCSKMVHEKDFKPNRLRITVKGVEAFIREYYDQNPISQLGIITSHSSIAEKLTELNGNPTRGISALKNITTGGEVSLQNSLEVARSSLKHVPKYGSREILLVYQSFTTVDPGDIHKTISDLKKDVIRCSVVGIGAETYICRKLADETSGTYSVACNEEHFQELLLLHTPPPPTQSKIEASLVNMGFPNRRTDNYPSLCVCHKVLKQGGYYCPKCFSKYCDLPTGCQICGLTLIASPHLARSYHHLFPIPVFKDNPPSNSRLSCSACLLILEPLAVSFVCPKCKHIFCLDCDIFIHESLHNCPGCSSSDT